MTAALRVRPIKATVLGVRFPPDWMVDTSGGCGCAIGWDSGRCRFFLRLAYALEFARVHAATHTCPSWRASGERCDTSCTDCGGKGWTT